MPRQNFTTTQLEFLKRRTIRLIDILHIELPGGSIKRFTNAENDVTSTINDGSTSEVYLAGQGYANHAPIPLTSQINANRVQFNFYSTLVDSSATEPVSRFFLNNPISGGSIFLAKRFIDTAEKGLDASPSHGLEFSVFRGFIDNVQFKITEQENQIALFCGGPFSNFDRVAIYGYTNSASQHKLFPNDTGFDFSAKNFRDIKWEE